MCVKALGVPERAPHRKAKSFDKDHNSGSI
jgi:hypothetical protein